MTRSLLLERGATPLIGPRPEGPVVALEPTPPSWLSEWCRDTCRALQTRPQPGEEWPPFSAGRIVHAVDHLVGRTVWVARGAHQQAPSRVVAAIRDLPRDVAVLAEAAAVSAYLGATLVVAHAVPRSFAERSVGLEDALDRGRWQLASAASAVAGRLPDGCVVSRLARVRPHELVGESLEADLLVMGGPRTGAGDRVGLVLSSALHHAPCPVLLAPRIPSPNGEATARV